MPRQNAYHKNPLRRIPELKLHCTFCRLKVQKEGKNPRRENLINQNKKFKVKLKEMIKRSTLRRKFLIRKKSLFLWVILSQRGK